MIPLISTAFGLLGNVTSLLIFLSPIKTFLRIVKNKSTEDFDVLPYVITLLNSFFWVYYGVTRPRILIAIVDGVGVVCESFYIVLYFIHAPPSKKVKTGSLLVFDVLFFTITVGFTYFYTHGSFRNDVIGTICVCLCSFSYTTPLAIMRLVIRTKSVEFMPFLLSFFIFINGVTWTTYAILVRDIFIGIPNGAGLLFGLAQLVLYAIYMNTRESRLATEASGKMIHQQEKFLEGGGIY